MESYIDHILSISEQLESIGQPFAGNVIGAIILGGLPEQFKPLILGIQGSKQITSVELVKSLLLQDDVKSLGQSSTLTAFSAKNDKVRTKGRRCFNCNQYDHISRDCPEHTVIRKKPLTTKREERSHFAAFSAGNGSISAKDTNWYLDTGATCHLTYRRDWIENFQSDSNPTVSIANGSQLQSNGSGSVSIPLIGGNTVTAEKVVHVPDLTVNLLAVNRLAKNGRTVIFNEKGCKIVKKEISIRPDDVLASATLIDGLYQLDRMKNRSFFAESKTATNLWHRRLGHLNQQSMKTLESTMATGIKINDFLTAPCEACIKGKHARTPFLKDESRRAKNILELVHSDVCGPMDNPSVSGAKYFVTFIDDFSRYTVVYFLKSKNEVFEKFEEYHQLVENQLGRRIKVLRTDNGTEYVNSQFHSFLRQKGIRHQTTVPYTPQQNGVAERCNRTLVECARSMLMDSNLSSDFWAEAVACAAYLKNRFPTKALQRVTPSEAWTGTKPNLKHLRVFGCKAFAKINDGKRKKFDSKSKEFIFVGYDDNTKGYRLIDPVTKKLTRSRDVIFFENSASHPIVSSDPFPHSSITSQVLSDQQFQQTFEMPVEVGEDNHLNHVIAPEVDDDDAEPDVSEISVSSDNDDEQTACGTQRPVRNRTANKHIFNNDFVVYQATCCQTDPTTIEEALRSPNAKEWKRAMEEEIEAHTQNKTWTIAPPPAGRKAVKCKWVFKTKQNADGTLAKYKARLVAKGCSQKPGIDYEETYSPVVRYSSIRFLVALAAKYDLDIDQMDVITAFLNPDLQEEIYMELPRGFKFDGETCRLNKTIYGLKQASRAWNMELNKLLKELGFKQSHFDTCVYYKNDGSKIMMIAVYVDDLLIFSNDKQQKNNLKMNLMKRFKMKDLGQAEYCLGIRIQRNREDGTITLDQEKYVKEMLNRFNMSDCNGVATPLDPNVNLFQEHEKAHMGRIPYQEAIGSLLYAAQATRPDISYAVGVLSRFNNNPNQIHWSAVKRVFRYLSKTSSWKLRFHKTDEKLHGYCDSDWGGDKNDLKSTTGYVYILSGAAVSWNSRKQTTVAKSSTEAEYMALSTAASEAIWLRGLLQELTPNVVEPVRIYCDNKGAVDLSKNPGYRPKTKHIAIQHHFTRERIDMGEISVDRKPSTEMIADSLTKGLAKDGHLKCSECFGLK